MHKITTDFCVILILFSENSGEGSTPAFVNSGLGKQNPKQRLNVFPMRKNEETQAKALQ